MQDKCRYIHLTGDGLVGWEMKDLGKGSAMKSAPKTKALHSTVCTLSIANSTFTN